MELNRKRWLSGFTIQVMWMTIICRPQNAAIQHLNMKFNRLNRITNGLQRDVEDIWTALSKTATNSGIVRDVSNETNSDDILKLVEETVSDVKNLKTEVEELVLYAKNGLRKEKAFSREALKEITTNQNETKMQLTDEILAMKNWLQSFGGTLQQNLQESIETFKSEAKENNRIFQEEVQNTTNKLKSTMEQNVNAIKRLSTETAKVRDEIDLVKDVINENYLLECDEGWESFGTNCYFNSMDENTWDDAWNFCKSKDSCIVEANNRNLTEFLLQKCEVFSFWVGATDRETEGSFIWQNSKEPVSPGHFHQNEPNNKGDNEHCLEFYCNDHGNFNDLPCERKRSFFCEQSRLIFN